MTFSRQTLTFKILIQLFIPKNSHASYTNIQLNYTLNIPQSNVDGNHSSGIADEQRDGNDSHNQPPERSKDQNFEEIITLNGCGKMKRRQSPAVIRSHQCSQEKDPELYSYNRLLLFMPWRNEQQYKEVKLQLLEQY
ncbi:hypothetical protein DPMN_071705 [Dreissena polymorpha]|uniref:Uncharacterized protein n=1 Tax=Dreissena polymorpha TaxID=45954 RepID=A0A9D3Z2T0_DREPO|nr:hypothetical protein DPMN_071705 [Dreissena polymorpha]